MTNETAIEIFRQHVALADERCTDASSRIYRAKTGADRAFWQRAHAERVAAWSALTDALKAAERPDRARQIMDARRV